MLTKQQAIDLCNSIPDGTYDERLAWLKNFGAYEMGKQRWIDSGYTLGLEQGIILALISVFDITQEDVDGRKPASQVTNFAASNVIRDRRSTD